VLAKELIYYRAHFREAVQKDGVICLECGVIFKYLPGHLCKHGLSSEEYRAKWGYNRTTPLERLITRRKKRRNAIAMKFGSLAPRDAHEKATKARQGHGLPYRPERRLVTTEAARARVAASFRQADTLKGPISQVSRPKDGVELSEEDHKVCRSETEDFGQVRSPRFSGCRFGQLSTGLSGSRKQDSPFRHQQVLDQFRTER
jgi:hypothetical protein